MKRFMRAMAGFGVLGVCLLMAGCSASFDPPPTPGVSSMGAIEGSVYGGNQPIIGAEVFLLEANSTAYAGPGIAATNGNASKSLLTSGDGSTTLNGVTANYVTTSGPIGQFSMTGKYTCDSGQVVYAYSVGGNPGAGGTNAAAGLMAVLGTCPTSAPFNLSSVGFIWMDEVTTVAAAYALAGFATDATHVGYSGSALGLLGIQNAFANAGNLVNLNTGTAYTTGTPGSVVGNIGTVPYKTINTIANILAACLNSSSSGSANCNTLFKYATSDGATCSSPPCSDQATDTATAPIYIAHNPGINMSNLFPLQAASGAPFSSDLSSAPNDWGIAVTYTGGGMNGPYMVAIDGSGNVWVDNTNANSLSKFSPLGVAKSSSGGYTGGGLAGVMGMAIDSSGDVWVLGSTSAFSEFGNNGTPISSTGYFPSGWAGGTGIAIDSSGDVWGASSAGVIKVHGSGASIGTTAIAKSTVGSQGQGLWVGLDNGGNVWTANSSTTLSKINSTATSGTAYTMTGITNTEWVTFDSAGNVWTCAGNGSGVDEVSNTGTAIHSVSGIAGVSSPFTIQLDGAGQVWLANSANTAISGLTSSATAISPSTGFISPLGHDLYAAAVDGSGNVWAIDNSNNLIQWVGMAAPLYTPVTPSKAATRP